MPCFWLNGLWSCTKERIEKHWRRGDCLHSWKWVTLSTMAVKHCTESFPPDVSVYSDAMCVCYWLQNPQCLQPWHNLCMCGGLTSQYIYKLHFMYLCDCNLAAIDEEEQKWESVKEEMQREKKKREVFWQVMLLRGEGGRERQQRGDWYRSALARSPDRRRLRQQQNWTHWTLCGPDWSQWLPALTPLHSETHTHTAAFSSNHWYV